MNKEITTHRQFPSSISHLGANYNQTQGALIIAALAEGESKIIDYNDSGDTDATIEFLSKCGIQSERSSDRIKVSGPTGWQLPRDEELNYDGAPYPLGLLMAVLAGRDYAGRVRYSNTVGGNFIELILKSFASVGINLKHDIEERLVSFQPSQLEPIEQKISFIYPHLKDALLMLGISSGRSVAIREEYLTADSFEGLILAFGGRITRREVKRGAAEDPEDPRRRVRRERMEYKKEMMLHPSTRLTGTEIKIMSDHFLICNMTTLLALKKGQHFVGKVPQNPEITRWLNYLKSIGVDISEEDRKVEGGQRTCGLIIRSRDFKGRRVAGDAIAGLIECVPLMALLAALST